MELAEKYNCGSIAFPSISTGVYRFPLEKAARIAVKTILDCNREDSKISQVIIVCFDEKTKSHYDAAL